MRSGADEMLAVLDEIRAEVTSNPCRMGDMAMRATAKAMRTLFRSKVPKRYSRDAAASELGVSVRQLSRLVAKAGIKPRRDGFKNVYYLEEDIEELRAYSR